MSSPDEMGLTPDAARGYESYFVPAIFGQWPPVLLKSARVSEGDDVLDIGCGTGVFTREALKAVGSTGSVTGADMSESMLTVAREISPTAQFERCNVMNLPFKDASFDAAVASFVLMFVPDQAAGLREMARVLRPNGRLVVSIWEGLDANAVYTELVRIVADVVDQKSGESIAWPFTLGANGVLGGLFEEAGLTPVSTTVEKGNAKFPSIQEFVKTEIESWLLADAVDEESMAKIESRAEEAFSSYRNGAGEMEFPFNAIIGSYVRAA